MKRTTLLLALLASMSLGVFAQSREPLRPKSWFTNSAQDAPLTEAEAAAQYIANLKRLLETRILPDLRRGALETSSSRPSALTIDLTDDPSAFNVESKVAPDGSLSVRLSIGYVMLHDAALDAVAVSAVLKNPRDLNRYLLYQLHLAHENHRRRAQGTSAHHAMTFAEFVGLAPQSTQRIFAHGEWRQSRDRVQIDSLGWTIAHLLVRADPSLAGAASLPHGAGAARLAVASGWFPVPPVATALGMAVLARSPAASFDERAVLCDAADLMDAGIFAIHANPDARAQRRIAGIRAQIERMRHDGRCASGPITARAVPMAGRASNLVAGHDGLADIQRALPARASRVAGEVAPTACPDGRGRADHLEHGGNLDDHRRVADAEKRKRTAVGLGPACAAQRR